jgi:hypothetical protein
MYKQLMQKKIRTSYVVLVFLQELCANIPRTNSRQLDSSYFECSIAAVIQGQMDDCCQPNLHFSTIYFFYYCHFLVMEKALDKTLYHKRHGNHTGTDLRISNPASLILSSRTNSTTKKIS